MNTATKRILGVKTTVYSHKAVWGRYKDVERLKIKIKQLGFKGEPDFIEALVKKTNQELEEFLTSISQ